MRIKKDFIPHTNGHERARHGMKIEYIVLHSMDGTADGTLSWFKKPSTEVAAHYLISKEGKITQTLKDNWCGYHAGIFEYNLKSIGIELEDEGKREEWIYPKKEIDALRWLVRKLCQKYKIPQDDIHILLHKNLVSDRLDPVGNFDIDWVL